MRIIAKEEKKHNFPLFASSHSPGRQRSETRGNLPAGKSSPHQEKTTGISPADAIFWATSCLGFIPPTAVKLGPTEMDRKREKKARDYREQPRSGSDCGPQWPVLRTNKPLLPLQKAPRGLTAAAGAPDFSRYLGAQLFVLADASCLRPSALLAAVSSGCCARWQPGLPSHG